MKKKFLVFKVYGTQTTGLSSRAQHKNRFPKLCIEFWDIGQNVSNFAGLVWKANFGHFFDDILGLGAYFSKPIFALKSWVQAGRFEYHEPHNLNNFFFRLLRGQSQTSEEIRGVLESSDLAEIFFVSL